MKKELFPAVLLLAASASLAAPRAQGKFMMPQPLPVERLAAGAERYITAHGDDPMGPYALARIHYAAFIYGATQVAAFPINEDSPPAIGDGPQSKADPVRAEAVRRVAERRNLAEPPPLFGGDADFRAAVDAEIEALRKSNWQAPAMPPADSLKHFLSARDGFEKAITMKPDDALFALGKASLWQQFSSPALRDPMKALPDLPAAKSDAELAELYLHAFELSATADAGAAHMPIRGISSLVSHEAGEAYLKLAPDAPQAAKVKAHLERLTKLPRGPITPLVFATSARDQALDSLIDANAKVSFDISGMKQGSVWPWLRPHAAFLVWNGDGTQPIHDGRQFFGTYTWGIFWRDGFQALSMLDSNGDQSISGPELEGIAVWQDRNGNATCEAGEVESLSGIGVTAIACVATGHDGIHPLHPQGITLRDGSQRPLWDWIAEPR
ncbi:hypothetical protein [Haloferula sp. BvORR071]|uniref:hypothetical protein n=1 Tax=Haloferula sp. BvORR071 TaxID=1396141 RepID=UPI000551AEF4|nr:hypothetical protein [Haloferula sp. BvORR071]